MNKKDIEKLIYSAEKLGYAEGYCDALKWILREKT